jgi:hypothetical protein
MLDDNRRKAMAAVGDFSHPTSLRYNLAPTYIVTLTIPIRSLRVLVSGVVNEILATSCPGIISMA